MYWLLQNAGWEHVKKFDIGFDMISVQSAEHYISIISAITRDRILMARSSWPNMLGYWGSSALE